MDARVDVDILLEQRHWLRALALRLARDDASADDLVQDTLLTAIERPPPRSDDVGGLRGWLKRVLHNRAVQDRRNAEARAYHEPQAARQEAVDEARGRDEALHQVRLQRVLAAAILELPEPYRKAITLRWVDGFSAREVAGAQGVTYEAARQRLARGAALLREKLDREWDRREAWSVVALALPKDVSPAARLVLPAVIAMSTLVKVGVAAVLLVAMCIWFVFARGGLSPHEGAPVVGSGPLEPASSPAEVVRDPGAKGVRTAAAPAPLDTSADGERVLSGVVLDPDDAPVADAQIEMLHNPSCGYETLDWNALMNEVSVGKTRSDATGRFHLDVPPGRPMALVAAADSFAHARLPFRYGGEDVVVRLERGATVRGSVLGKDDDAPAVGARVRLFERVTDRESRVSDPHVSFTETTDAGGRFRIDGVGHGNYILEVLPVDDSPPNWKNIDVTAGALIDLDIRVAHSPPLVGVITDAQTKLPIGGASIGEAWVMNRAVQTNALGEFTLKGFPVEGISDVGVRAHGYGFKTVRVRADRNAALPEKLAIALEPARRARGRVLDARGQPVAGALVLGLASRLGAEQQMDWVTTTSSSSGAFELADLRPDLPHVLQVRREGYGTVAYEFPPYEIGHAIVELGDVVLADMATVRGRVHRSDGEGVADHLVTLVGWNADRLRSKAMHRVDVDAFVGERQARTDDQGCFVFVDVAAGAYELQVRARGVQEPVHRSVEVAVGSRVDGQDLVLDTGLTIAGRVIGPDGEPVFDCHVSANPVGEGPPRSNASVQSDARGLFRMSGLTPGAYQLSVSPFAASDQRNEKKRYARRTFGPVSAGDQNVVIVLQVATVLRGRVLDAKGAPVGNAYLIAKSARPGHESVRHTVDAGGRFEIEIPADIEVELVAGPPPPEVPDAVDTTTGIHMIAVSASTGSDPEPDPAHAVRRAGLHAGDAEVELRLPVALGEH